RPIATSRTTPYPANSHSPSLHDALPILVGLAGHALALRRDLAAFLHFPHHGLGRGLDGADHAPDLLGRAVGALRQAAHLVGHHRSEEHTSELQSREHLVCRLLTQKKTEQ